jgi:hypothetical protein
MIKRVLPCLLLLALAGCDSADLLGIDLKLGKGDVKSKHIKDESVTTRKLDDKAVTAPKIGSGDASAGRVLTSDGNGGATWEHPPGGGGLPVVDSTNIVFGSADNTKLLRFEVDGFTAGATRVMTPPDADITVAGINIAQTFALKQTFSVAPTSPVGTKNERFGELAGASLTTGQQNAYFGYNAGTAGTAGSFNAALGCDALSKCTTGVNVAVGHQALRDVVGGGDYSTGVGAGALKQWVSGSYNVAVGANAMMTSTNGTQNTAVGGSAMRAATNGGYDVAVGHNAGFNMGKSAAGTGRYNVAVGHSAGFNIDAGSGNIVLGASADTSSAGASNEFVAGSGSHPVDNVYFGKGATNATPTAYTIRGTGGSGAVNGADIQIAGGTAGAAAQTGGSIVFQTAKTGTGTTLTTRVKISPAGIMNTFKGGDVASAASVTPSGNVFKVTGNTPITAVATAGITAGTRITMIFTDTPGPTVTDNDGALNLAGNFAADANDTLTLIYDGTNWLEVSRSAN